MMRLIVILACIIGAISYSVGQEATEISLNNPSFEDIPRHSTPPRGWRDCGFKNESPPDVQPSGFSVTKAANEGETYLGLVVRDNSTWEAVGQRLSAPLEKGSCYEFSIYMSRSELYVSQSHITGKDANYTTPAKLRIYAGYNYCDKQYLLAESTVINSPRWIKYSFKLEPIGDYTHIILEAFYRTPTLFPYNGHILLDNASSIVQIPCDDTQMLTEVPEVAETPIDEVVVDVENPEIDETPTDENIYNIIDEQPQEEPDRNPTPPQQEKEKPLLAGLERSQLKKGQIVKIDNIYFQIDQANIQSTSYTELDKLFIFLRENPDVSVEIGGHTNGLPTEHWFCDSLSTARAKAVAQYLSGKGIDMERLAYKGYGKRKPLFSDRTEYGRRKNQRVEIKILNINS